MKNINLVNEINNIYRPVLILSSKTGLGNYSVGCVIQEMINYKSEAFHYCIEDWYKKRHSQDED